MITHRDFESDCKRIANEIKRGEYKVIVSRSFVVWFNKEIRRKRVDDFNEEISKYLQRPVLWDNIGTGCGWYLTFKEKGEH